jgi:AAA+ superfamily predicted ATPase
VVFGTIMAHRLDGDPVWLFLIGPPGDGKTEVVRSMSADEAIYTLSSLKPAALISGFQNDKRH